MHTLQEKDVANIVQTEIKLHMTQQLNLQGYLSDEIYTIATEIILEDSKKSAE